MVEIKLPTVSCVPVAIREPELSVVIIELAAPVNEVPFMVTVVTEPESEAITPPPTKFITACEGKSDPSSWIKLYPPFPVPKQTPLTETHPSDTAIPPAKVEVDVLVTERFVSEVVPKLELPADIEPAFITVFVIVPPLIVGLFINVLVSWSIL